jgi:nicotinate-nucleotide adenylyltransferase
MVRAAIAGQPGLEVLTLEADRGGVSYTVDTLRELHAHYAAARFWLCLGADSLREIATWRDPQAIAKLARFAVYRRGEEAGPVPPDLTGAVDWVAGEPVAASSTQVRDRIARGLAVLELVAPGVLAIIQREGLYTAGQEG